MPLYYQDSQLLVSYEYFKQLMCAIDLNEDKKPIVEIPRNVGNSEDPYAVDPTVPYNSGLPSVSSPQPPKDEIQFPIPPDSMFSNNTKGWTWMDWINFISIIASGGEDVIPEIPEVIPEGIPEIPPEIEPGKIVEGVQGSEIIEISISDLPQNVQDSYYGYQGNGWKGNYNGQTPGMKAGGRWDNELGQLPQYDSFGNAINYKEFDINPKTSATRDAERFVHGSDDSTYYTNDHYTTFIRIS